MTDEQLNRLGEIADSIENVRYAMELPLPPQFHLNQVKEAMTDWINDIRELANVVKGSD